MSTVAVTLVRVALLPSGMDHGTRLVAGFVTGLALNRQLHELVEDYPNRTAEQLGDEVESLRKILRPVDVLPGRYHIDVTISDGEAFA